MQNTISQIFKYCFSGYGQFIICRTKVEAKAYLKNNSSIYRIKDLLTITDELRQKISDTPRHDVFEIIDNVAVPLEIEMTDDEGVAEQWKDRLHTIREKSVAGINFSDALDVVITRDEWNELSEEKQIEMKQAWLYPTNDDGEIEFECEDCIRSRESENGYYCYAHTEERNDDDSAEREYETIEDVVREEIEENEEIASDDEVDQWFIERAHEFKFHPFVTTCSMCFKREAFYVGVTQHGTPFEFCRQCRNQLQALKIERTQSPERFGV